VIDAYIDGLAVNVVFAEIAHKKSSNASSVNVVVYFTKASVPFNVPEGDVVQKFLHAWMLVKESDDKIVRSGSRAHFENSLSKPVSVLDVIPFNVYFHLENLNVSTAQIPKLKFFYDCPCLKVSICNIAEQQSVKEREFENSMHLYIKFVSHSVKFMTKKTSSDLSVTTSPNETEQLSDDDDDAVDEPSAETIIRPTNFDLPQIIANVTFGWCVT